MNRAKVLATILFLLVLAVGAVGVVFFIRLKVQEEKRARALHGTFPVLLPSTPVDYGNGFDPGNALAAEAAAYTAAQVSAQAAAAMQRAPQPIGRSMGQPMASPSQPKRKRLMQVNFAIPPQRPSAVKPPPVAEPKNAPPVLSSVSLPRPKPSTPIEPPKAEPPKAEPPKAESLKVESPKVEPPKVESLKVEPPKVESPKVEPLKKEPPPVVTSSQPGPNPSPVEPTPSRLTASDTAPQARPPVAAQPRRGPVESPASDMALKIATATDNAGTRTRPFHNDLVFNPFPGITAPLLVDKIVKDRTYDVLIHKDPPPPPQTLAILRRRVLRVEAAK